MGYSEDADGNVVLTMQRQDYETLLRAMGCFIAATGPTRNQFAWVNRVNEGNPRFTPYDLSSSAPSNKPG